ncbi:MAG: hypothetical protein ACKV2T_18565 [Kofleriaceae bacterium]
MISKVKNLAASLALLVPLTAVSVGCSSESEQTERWATTENTNVKIDWDQVNEAYKQANGPEDLEKRINEIYEGDEIISISVQDLDNKVQVVTGFFDKNTDGNVDEPEKIFTIKREITGEGTAQMQTTGHGHYYGYSSPFMGIATGMLLGSMMSSMFMPSYMPMYSTPYATSPNRAAQISQSRSTHRSANPAKYQRSQSGRSYSSPSRSSGGGRSGGGGGGRFGLARVGRTTQPTLLVD